MSDEILNIFSPKFMSIMQDVNNPDNISSNINHKFVSYDQLIRVIENMGMVSFIRNPDNKDKEFKLVENEVKQFLSLLGINVKPDEKCKECKYNLYLHCYTVCEDQNINDDE